jgi:tricorn protease
VVSLPVKAANYVGLDAGKAGTLYLSEIPDVPSLNAPTTVTVSKFDLTSRKTEAFVAGVTSFAVSANGEKVLFKQGPGPGAPWFIGR